MTRRVIASLLLSLALLNIITTIDMTEFYFWYAFNVAKEDELLPHELLKAGDTFKLIVDINNNQVTSFTYHYEYAE
jgi:hypothetical protein